MKLNYFKGLVGLFVFTLLILVAPLLPHASAEAVKDIIAEYTYNMGDGETPTGAEEKAILQAKRIAIEQAGTYIESYSEVVNSQLTKDEIRAVAGGVIQTTVLDKRKTATNEGFFIYVKIKADIDTAKIKDILSNRSAMEQNKKLQEDNAKLLSDMEQLKSQLQQANNSQNIEAKKLTQTAMLANEEQLRANELVEQGNRYYQSGQYDLAINANSQALAINPQFVFAYNNRGVSYYSKGQYDLANADFTQAITLNPRYANAYENRAAVYSARGLVDLGIADYSQAISIDNKSADAYGGRGYLFNSKRMFDQAIADFNQGIALSPNNAFLFNNRGYAYASKGMTDFAIADFNQAITADNSYAAVYFNKAITLDKAGRSSEAAANYKLYLQYAASNDPFVITAKERLRLLKL